MEIGTAAAASAASAAKSAGGVALLGAGAGVAAALATVVVLLTKKPRTDQEWGVAIISTVICSLCGGAAVILHFGLLKWVLVPDLTEAFVGLIALIGIAFSCGLPGWAIVRWVFNWISKREGQDIGQVIADVRSEAHL
jgi:hypothetical protein